MADFTAKIGNIRLKGTADSRSLMLGDGMANFLTGIGGGRDPQSYATWTPNFTTQSEIENCYRTSGYGKKIHIIPPTDATRAWRSFQADDADITAIEQEERRLGVQEKTRKAEIVARMYGGSVMLMGTKDGDLTQELDVTKVGKADFRYLHVISKNRINVPNLVLDPGSTFYQQPDQYIINGGNGQPIPCHPSRIIRYVHGDLPDDVLETQQAWGDPLLHVIASTLANSETAQKSFAILLNQAKLDTVYVPGLTSMVSTTEGEQRLIKRFMVAKGVESLLGVKLMEAAESKDGASESWETRQINWAGIPDVMLAFIQVLAGACDIPVTRLLGTSPTGMSATGEHDETNYYQMIKASQEFGLRPRLDMLDQVLIRSALGTYPDGYRFDFNPLHVDSDEVRAKNAKARAEATKIYSDANIVPPEVLQEAVKNQLIESGEYPGIEQAYDDYSAGNLDSLIEEPEEAPADPLIPVDPLTGMPTQNRESRLFAANDIASRLLADGATTLEAITEAHRLTDATPRPLYVSRHLINGEEIRAHFEKQGIKVTVPNEKLHTTVCYSKAPIDWFAVAPADDWGDAEIVVKAGGARMMAKFGPTENAIVMMFASSRFSWRHEEFIRAGASYDWEYQPHFTLNYEGQKIDLDKIEPFKGELRFGPEDFREIQEGWSATA